MIIYAALTLLFQPFFNIILARDLWNSEEGGAISGDKRFGIVFIYHYGAEAYYDGRGFRGFLGFNLILNFLTHPQKF